MISRANLHRDANWLRFVNGHYGVLARPDWLDGAERVDMP